MNQSGIDLHDYQVKWNGGGMVAPAGQETEEPLIGTEPRRCQTADEINWITST